MRLHKSHMLFAPAAVQRADADGLRVAVGGFDRLRACRIGESPGILRVPRL